MIANQVLKIFNRASIKLGIVLALITLIGLNTVGHYGLSMDEANHVLILKWTWEYLQHGKPMPGDTRFHGIVFNSAAEIIFQVKHWLEHYSFAPLFSTIEENSELLTSERYLTKHVFTFCFCLLTYISVARGITLLYRKNWAWLAPLILAFFPRFWGHSFFNPKDIPFAALFTLCIYLGAYVVTEIKQDSSPAILGKIQRGIIWSIGYGILVGLLSGIRIGGFMILGFVGLVSLILMPREKIRRFLISYCIHYSLMIVSWGLTIVSITPASWSNPSQWFWDAIQYFSQHEFPGTVLFKGEYIKASELPWDYLPTYFLITIPTIFLIYFVLGLISLTRTYSQFSDRQKAYSLLVLLQIFVLPGIAIVKGSTLYDVVRHFLFVLPGIAVISTVGLIWSYQQISRPKFKRALVIVTLLGMSIVAFDIVTLHPYEYIYFNRISGGLKAAAGQHETEYWGLSMREGMEWLNKNGQKGTIVATPSVPWLAKPFADSHFRVTDHKPDFDKIDLGNADRYYYLATLRWNWHEIFFTDCDFIYTLTRQGVPLAKIKECQLDDRVQK